MAKLVIQHDTDPAIGIVLEECDPMATAGYRGSCTQCGRTVHGWILNNALRYAKRHVDSHEAVVIGEDPSSVAPGHRVRETLAVVGHNID